MSRLLETFRVGDLDVAALSDGAPDRALGGFFNGIEPAEWMPALGITDPEQPLPFNFGAFLVRGGGLTVLVDSGYGPPAAEMGIPGGGELLARLRDLGVEPAAVDTIVHTHMHVDHCGWDVDEAGQLNFPNATFLVADAELDYWLGLAPGANPQAPRAREIIQALEASGRLETFAGEHSVSESLTMIPTPGHTPGHASVMLASGGEKLLITGDAAHHPTHLEHHDWLPAIDVDPAQSRQSRAKLAALAADQGARVTGGHFPILTIGRIERVETGYRWLPA